MIDICITSEAISGGELPGWSSDEAAGAVASFVGLVRNRSGARPDSVVVRLEYEAYIPMAERELLQISQECKSQYGALRIVVHHRVGVLAIGDVAVSIVVWTAHRDEAFGGCRYIIEEIKKRVPIWKREVFEDGFEWVNAHP